LVQGKCGATESIESLTQKLKIIKQGGKTAEEFAAEVQSLTDRMASIEITRSQAATPEARRAVQSVFKQQGLTAFQNGVNPALKPTIIASRPTTVEEALNVAVTAQASGIVAPVKVESLFYSENQGDCYNCGRSGHRARECRSNGRGGFVQRNQGRFGHIQSQRSQNYQTRGGQQHAQQYGQQNNNRGNHGNGQSTWQPNRGTFGPRSNFRGNGRNRGRGNHRLHYMEEQNENGGNNANREANNGNATNNDNNVGFQ
jgi:Zinc knuckle